MVLHGDNCEDEYPGGDVGSTVTSDKPVDTRRAMETALDNLLVGLPEREVASVQYVDMHWTPVETRVSDSSLSFLAVNCIPLTGSGSSTETESSSTETGSASSTTTAATETLTADSFAASSTGTDASTTETQTTDAPSTDAPVATTQATQAPSTATEAPSTDTSTTETKFNAPARRLRKKITTA